MSLNCCCCCYTFLSAFLYSSLLFPAHCCTHTHTHSQVSSSCWYLLIYYAFACIELLTLLSNFIWCNKIIRLQWNASAEFSEQRVFSQSLFISKQTSKCNTHTQSLQVYCLSHSSTKCAQANRFYLIYNLILVPQSDQRVDKRENHLIGVKLAWRKKRGLRVKKDIKKEKENTHTHTHTLLCTHAIRVNLSARWRKSGYAIGVFSLHVHVWVTVCVVYEAGCFIGTFPRICGKNLALSIQSPLEASLTSGAIY